MIKLSHEDANYEAVFFIIFWTLFTMLTGCDPTHHLTLENKTDKTVQVIYLPEIDGRYLNGIETEKINIRGQEMNILTLDSGEIITIGSVSAMYTPKASDIHLQYLELRYGSDTLRLSGKNAIFSTIQKVKKLDWRLLIK
ncbi:MAG: hypothetical protein GC181_09245 [Bacteroidetes bacterium]|nr:hypothetical protein [Bacteroidota bacterium]